MIYCVSQARLSTVFSYVAPAVTMSQLSIHWYVSSKRSRVYGRGGARTSRQA